MRLMHYITEGTSTQIDFKDDVEMYKIIRDNCYHYMNEMSTGPRKMRHLYRGIRKGIKIDKINKVIPRTERLPSNTKPALHKWLDDIFYKKYGWRARSEGVFVDTSYFNAQEYGSAYLFFPVGRYKYLYNTKIDDLYIASPGQLDGYIEGTIFDAGTTKRIEKFKDELHNYKSSGLVDAKPKMDNHFEVMFKCDSYIALSANYQEKFDWQYSQYRGR